MSSGIPYTWCKSVFTCIYLYVPTYTMLFYNSVHTLAEKYILVHTRMYFSGKVHTSTYQYVPQSESVYHNTNSWRFSSIGTFSSMPQYMVHTRTWVFIIGTFKHTAISETPGALVCTMCTRSAHSKCALIFFGLFRSVQT